MIDWDAYEATGRWLAENTPSDATAGMVEIGQVGYFSERHVEDYLGLVDPLASEMLARGDRYSWFASYAPNYLVLHRPSDEPIAIYSFLLELDPWFQASYAPVHRVDDPRYAHGEVIIYQRTAPLREMRATPANLDFGPLRLTGFATDAVDLAAGGPDGMPVRVRLDWQRIGTMPEGLHLSLTALDAGATPNFDLDYAGGTWSRTFSTWGTLVLDPDLPPGGYPVVLDVQSLDSDGDRIETLAEGQPVGWLDISYPRAAAQPEEAPTFGQADGDSILLADSAIAAEEGQLQVTLEWLAGTGHHGGYTRSSSTCAAGRSAPGRAGGRPATGWGAIPPIYGIGGSRADGPGAGCPPRPGGDYELVVGWYIAPNGPRQTLPMAATRCPWPRSRSPATARSPWSLSQQTQRLTGLRSARPQPAAGTGHCPVLTLPPSTLFPASCVLPLVSISPVSLATKVAPDQAQHLQGRLRLAAARFHGCEPAANPQPPWDRPAR